jgi:hypothetical protein
MSCYALYLMKPFNNVQASLIYWYSVEIFPMWRNLLSWRNPVPFCAIDLCESDDMPGGNSKADLGMNTKLK